MKNQVLEHWDGAERGLPGYDAIIYPNGNITLFNCYGYRDRATNEYRRFCRPLCDTTIDSIVKYNGDPWVSVESWTSVGYGNGKIYGGDGSMGNEGHIACVDGDDNLLWAMFFTNTNPIKALEIKGNTLIAVNEHDDLTLEINLDCLTDIKIVSDEVGRIPCYE